MSSSLGTKVMLVFNVAFPPKILFGSSEIIRKPWHKRSWLLSSRHTAVCHENKSSLVWENVAVLCFPLWIPICIQVRICFSVPAPLSWSQQTFLTMGTQNVISLFKYQLLSVMHMKADMQGLRSDISICPTSFRASLPLCPIDVFLCPDSLGNGRIHTASSCSHSDGLTLLKASQPYLKPLVDAFLIFYPWHISPFLWLFLGSSYASGRTNYSRAREVSKDT